PHRAYIFCFRTTHPPRRRPVDTVSPARRLLSSTPGRSPPAPGRATSTTASDNEARAPATDFLGLAPAPPASPWTIACKSRSSPSTTPTVSRPNRSPRNRPPANPAIRDATAFRPARQNPPASAQGPRQKTAARIDSPSREPSTDSPGPPASGRIQVDLSAHPLETPAIAPESPPALPRRAYRKARAPA